MTAKYLLSARLIAARSRSGFLVFCLPLFAACASTAPVVVGTPRPAIPVEQVVVYSHPPPAFQDIASLTASSKSAFGPGGPKQIDKVVDRLKAQAAQLGANGLILEGFSDAETASVGTGAGSTSYSGHTAVGVGVGGSFGIFKKTGKARAIFVPPVAGAAPTGGSANIGAVVPPAQ